MSCERLALKIVMQNDLDFVDLILLYSFENSYIDIYV